MSKSIKRVVVSGVASLAMVLGAAGVASAAGPGQQVVGRGPTVGAAFSNAVLQCDSKSGSGSSRQVGSEYVVTLTCN